MAKRLSWLRLGKGRGQAEHLKELRPMRARTPWNPAASRRIELIDNLKNAARQTVLSPENFQKAAQDISEFKDAGDALRRFSDAGMGEEVIKFTRAGKAGTMAARPGVRAAAGVPISSTLDEAISGTAEAFQALRKSGLDKVMSASVEALQEAARIGDTAAKTVLESNATKNAMNLLKGRALLGISAGTGLAPFDFQQMAEDLKEAEKEAEFKARGA